MPSVDEAAEINVGAVLSIVSARAGEASEVSEALGMIDLAIMA